MNGKLITFILADKPLELPIFPLVQGRELEMLDFGAKHHLTSEIEFIRMDYINTAMDRLAKSDVRYHCFIDVSNSLTK
ncbi:hypothetical protein DCAR_0934160 [Daucus carota subsp. sativus]|uniref:Uncharacterized protein n=1 Tax=Daucus carota subsp. sativus TaxID=79200 RepID=A0AAF0XUY2_DAUCS|nr:hypothetical protein DCAR_0934160 [Daucus carota subsp. sativus]